MNFLAHLFLSREKEEEVAVGNFMGDFVRNRDLERYSPGIRQGVILHRRIDSFTDRHPEVLRGVRRLYGNHGKYAPVITDIFYDHLLAKNWEDYASDSLFDFAQDTYRVLEKYLEIMPRVLKNRLPLMIRDNWLVRYYHLDGIAFTFDRMKARATRPSLLDHAVESLLRDFDALEAEFHSFFPDLIEFVRQAEPDQPSK